LTFFITKGVVFGVPKYSDALAEIHKSKDVDVKLG